MKIPKMRSTARAEREQRFPTGTDILAGPVDAAPSDTPISAPSAFVPSYNDVVITPLSDIAWLVQARRYPLQAVVTAMVEPFTVTTEVVNGGRWLVVRLLNGHRDTVAMSIECLAP